MASGSVTITIKAEWREEDASGEACVNCGDTAWLSQTRLYMVLSGEAIATEYVFCSACGDGLRANHQC